MKRSQISIILTYEVLGNELDTLMNLKDIFLKIEMEPAKLT